MKPKRAPAPKSSAGGTLVGLFIGLVLGIVGAAAVVWYINKMPTPFKQPPVQPSAKNEASRPTAEGPVPLPGKPGDPVPEKRFQFYDILPGKTEAKVENAPAAGAADTAKASAANAVREPVVGQDAVYLQAGSFQSPGDADNQKAKLAMIGMEAAVQQVMLQDKVWYRVRLGPYAKTEEANKVRAELVRHGIDAAVTRKD